jgi:hypothetical protein
VADVLVVAALQLRDPMHLLVPVKAGDPTLDAFHTADAR